MKTPTATTLADFTEPEVFYFIAQHLLRQLTQSADEGMCRYHFGDLKCAAGILFPDAVDTTTYEGHGWDELVAEGQVPAAHEPLITRLQKIHDRCKTHTWATQLQTCAQDYGIPFDIPEIMAREYDWKNRGA